MQWFLDQHRKTTQDLARIDPQPGATPLNHATPPAISFRGALARSRSADLDLAKVEPEPARAAHAIATRHGIVVRHRPFDEANDSCRYQPARSAG
jgi:hypothetical protein